MLTVKDFDNISRRRIAIASKIITNRYY